MELILKSDNRSKMAKILALADKLGINVIQRDTQERIKPIPPKGKVVAVNQLLETFGNAPDFPSVEEILHKEAMLPF